MTDSMKFGPEWLRNLSQDGCTQPTVAPTPRYQLAEHRYGREEMLALFDRLVKAPDTLVGIPALYVEKTQTPLALLQMTEEETRMWNRGINSDVVLRPSLKAPAGMPGGPRGSRGGSMDRGRGRGRGAYHYTRGLSYEEPGDGGERGVRNESGPGSAAVSYPRTIRSYDRSQGSGVERGWSERNGADPGDWNGSTSPRKEFGGRGFMNDNWRRHRGGGEDEDGWRTATSRSEKWGGRPNSWREGDKDCAEVDRGRSQGWERGRGWDDTAPPHHPHRRPWDEDNLPEWAMENPSESGGSFDASGAFHGGGGMSDEEEVDGVVNSSGRQHRVRLLSEGNTGKRPQQTRRSGLLSRDPGLSRSTEEEPTRTTEDSGTDRLTGNGAPSQISSATPTKKSPPPISSSTKKSPVQSSQASDMNCEPDGRPEPTPVPTSVSSVVPQHVNSNAASVKRSAANGITRNVSAEVLMTVPTTPTTNLNAHNSVNIRFPVPSEVVVKQTVVGVTRRQKSEDDMERMQEVADDLVAKLMDDEEGQEKVTGVPDLTEKWFYRDPQGEVQGPFSSSEMAEWFRSGYFTLTLLVRRGCDERYSQLGDLIKAWGRIPFMPGPTMPPLKTTEAVSTPEPTVPQPTLTQGVPAGLSQEAMLMHQYQYQILQRQIQIRQAAAVQAAVGKLSQSEHWSSLSPLEQQQLVVQQMAHQPVDASINPFIQPKNPVLQLISQLQQQSKVPAPVVPEPKLSPSAVPTVQLDPLQKLIRDMGGQPLGLQSIPPTTTLNIQSLLHPPTPAPVPADKVDDPIQSLMRQLGSKAFKPQVDSVWGASVAPAFNAQSWLQQMGPVPSAPPGQLPTSLWDLHGKDMKTEQQILDEQMRAEEGRRREEQRKQQEEAKRQEEAEKRKQLEEELRKQEAEKKRLEEHMQRLEEERQRQEEELKRRQAEEERLKKQAEEERKRQEEAKRLEEEQRKKEEAAKRKEEEKKRREEERERKKKLEEERKREEDERKRQEEEQARKKQEEEEQVRRLEQQRRQTEALRRLQEQQQRAKAAPWSQQAAVPPVGGNLADIQRQEKEKKEREAREQQQVLLQLQQQQQQQQLQNSIESNNRSNGNSIQLKWAEKKSAAASKVKSLSEIQAEEQEQLAKQQERERAERAQQQKEVALPPCASIWGTAAQSLSWATAATGTNSTTTPAWGGAGTVSGNGNSYWEDVVPPTQKPPTKIAAAKPKPPVSGTTGGKGGSKTRSKKEEAQVLKLFEQNTQRGDEFVQWCSRALDGLQSSVDIPTFVIFLRDIESPFEVKDYVRLYLGESKEAQEFARQFLERRSKWRSAQRAVPLEDDMCMPAPAINPLDTDFQEVKGKGKKTKKSKMLRLDNRILGFNVTAAQDRINVGDRDYGEGM